MSMTLRCPNEYTIAFGPVATGSIKAKFDAWFAGKPKYTSEMFMCLPCWEDGHSPYNANELKWRRMKQFLENEIHKWGVSFTDQCIQNGHDEGHCGSVSGYFCHGSSQNGHQEDNDPWWQVSQITQLTSNQVGESRYLHEKTEGQLLNSWIIPYHM